MRKGTILVTLALAASALAHSAHALDIKGLRIDQPVDCAAIKALETRSGTFYPSCQEGKETWVTVVSFLSGRAQLWATQSPDERVLLSITVMEFDFDEALAALKVKVGEPVIKRSVVSNAMGATFEQVEAMWTEGDQRLVLKKHAGRINEPQLMLFGQRYVEHMRKAEKAKAQQNAGNL